MNLTALALLLLKTLGVLATFGIALLIVCVIAGAREDRRINRLRRGHVNPARIAHDYRED